MLVGESRGQRSSVLGHRWQTDTLPFVGQGSLGPLLRKHRSLLLLGHHLKLLMSLNDLLVAEVRKLLDVWLVVDWLPALVDPDKLLLYLEVVRLVAVGQ